LLAFFASLVEWLVVSSADKTAMLSHFAGDFLIVWIPACAGMTGWCVVWFIYHSNPDSISSAVPKTPGFP
jgi:hypothetical protein